MNKRCEFRRAAGTAGLLVACLPARAWAHAVLLERELPATSEYFRLGVEHILGGIDHLLFLAGLVLVGAGVRDLLWAVTAFTLAHSITLAASVFGIVTPNPAWIEVLIALSISYVGVENLLRPGVSAGRWRLTFAFGLIHGFGFAGALREIGVPADRSAATLLLFNLGVEAGQLAVLAVVIPIVTQLRKLPRMRGWGVPALSGCLAIVGLVWAVSRTMSAETASARGAAQSQPAAESVADSLTDQSQKQDPEPAPQSTYPREAGTPPPSVAALCSAFHALPRTRRAECKGTKPGVQFTSECVRMLSAAVASGAIRLDPDGVEQCTRAQHARYADCAFTSARSLPALPVCSALWQGTRAQGVACRSSLECATGLHCQGVSPLESGFCRPPKPVGARCGQAVDPLATYLPSAEAQHAECQGTCARGRCE